MKDKEYYNPEYACQVDSNTGEIYHWMAFIPKYGPKSQAQIDWHIQHRTPGADTWEIDVPLRESKGVWKPVKKNKKS